MASPDNLYDVIEELRGIVADLKRTLYGDQATRAPGLLVELDGLRRDVKGLETDLHQIKNRRPNVGAWTSGYVVFCAALVFAVVGIVNQFVDHNALGLPPAVALWLAVAAMVVAGVLFAVGYGWFERQ